MAPLIEDMAARRKFGWKNAEDFPDFPQEISNKAKYLARDKDMPNYELIAALEKKYYATKGKLLTYEPANPFIVIILFLLGLLPLIVYLVYKSSQKNECSDYNFKIRREMDSISQEASLLL